MSNCITGSDCPYGGFPSSFSRSVPLSGMHSHKASASNPQEASHKVANIDINRKMLAEMAVNDAEGFAKLAELAKSKVA